MERLLIASSLIGIPLALAMGAALAAVVVAIGRIEQLRLPAARALITDDGPPLHAPIPPFEWRALDGALLTSADYAARETLMLFVSPDCPACDSVLASLRAVSRTDRRRVDLVLVVDGDTATAGRVARQARCRARVVADELGVIRSSLAIARTPVGLLVDSGGVVRMKGVVNNGAQLEGLIRRRGRRLLEGEMVQVAADGRHAETAA